LTTLVRWLRVRYIHALPQERRDEVLEQLSLAASPGFDYFLLVFLSCSIATFGLTTDSAAVIIGAMLIAPLMSPILGLSLASVAGKSRMFERALLALVEGALLAIGLSALLGWVAQELPFGALMELNSEVISRTRPSPFDLGIALAGGAAAAYALAQPHLSAALPGVAIATALMPPLCSVGICLSVERLDLALGALLLFLTNFAAITFAGIIVFAMLGFRPPFPGGGWRGLSRPILTSAILVLLVTFPLLALTLRFVGEASLARAVRAAVQAELNALPDARLVEITTDASNSTVQLDVTLRASRQPFYQEVVDFQSGIATRLQRPVALHLVVIPMTVLDPLVPPTHTPTPTSGPTATATKTPAPTATLTPTPSETPMPTFTPTTSATPTYTATSTPHPARIVGTGGRGVFLRVSPGGEVLPGAFLDEGASIFLLYQRQELNGIVWLQVRDAQGREGWVKAMFVLLVP